MSCQCPSGINIKTVKQMSSVFRIDPVNSELRGRIPDGPGKWDMVEVLGSQSQIELTVTVTVTVTVTAIVLTHALRLSPGHSEPFKIKPTS
jgi:hypothetical protein